MCVAKTVVCSLYLRAFERYKHNQVPFLLLFAPARNHVSYLKGKHHLKILKPFQNKKGQKNLRYPTKKQSFCLEKDCFFVGYLKFFGPSYFETALLM